MHSLGKERGRSRLKYLFNFYRYLFTLRYDAAFVHMNEEYVLLGGGLWRLMGKPIYLWRNYHRGSILTALAVALSTKAFCTSKHSYTAKFKKTMLMPVGVDTARFYPDARISRVPHSILFLSGMWPSKRPEMLIEALGILKGEGVDFTANLYGSPLSDTEAYYESVKQAAHDAGLLERVTFHPGVPNDQTPDIYRAHALFVNCSPSGMFDKTLFEAAASGAYVLSSSADFAAIAGSETYFDSVPALAERLRTALSASSASLASDLVERNSLTALVEKLAATL
jgi:glycosyltransferase involved in cell wall biosynthesis